MSVPNCPHCSVPTQLKFISHNLRTTTEGVITKIEYAFCEWCDEVIIRLNKSRLDIHSKGVPISGSIPQLTAILLSSRVVHPTETSGLDPKSIKTVYLDDYLESKAILGVSPKASAALSRRLLQHIIREEYKIKRNSLAQELQAFIQLPGIPSYLTDAVDAVRNIGNLAAHPAKDRSTGEIVAVQPGEAEWLIEVIEALFDFTFIQPQKLKERRDALNEKLLSLGKPPLKEGNKQSQKKLIRD